MRCANKSRLKLCCVELCVALYPAVCRIVCRIICVECVLSVSKYLFACLKLWHKSRAEIVELCQILSNCLWLFVELIDLLCWILLRRTQAIEQAEL